MNPSPTVSVVIPCFNGGRFLADAVRSVRSQGGPPVEVIVVDDASTDDSAAVADVLAAADSAVRVIRQPTNRGPAAARNAGFRTATGRYIGFLDADDEYAPGFLADTARVLDTDPTVTAAITGVELIDCHRPVDPVQLDAVVGSVPTNLLVRREAVELIGGFPEDPAFRGPYAGEDIAFRQALARHFRLARIDRPLLRHRVHPGGHFERFLDRSTVVNGQLVFTRTEDGHQRAYSAATAAYDAEVRRRVLAAGHRADLPPTDDPMELVRAGVELAQEGRFEEALPLLERAAWLAPTNAQVRLNLGVALADVGRLADAEAQLREAIRLQPSYADAYFNLGNVARVSGRTADANSHFRTAIRLRPDHTGSLINLGLALTEAGRPAEAVPLLQHATRLEPGAVAAHNNLGLALAALGRFAEADAAYERALRVDPRAADALSNLAGSLLDQGRLDESLGYYELAVGFAPDAAVVRYNRSLALLKAGDFAQGWREYEWRWHRGPEQHRVRPGPRWDGSPLDGRTVLLWSEQGLGDTIQFVRYARRVRALGGTVVVECPPPLKPLLANCPGIDALVAEGDPLPRYDCQIPLLSLPGVLGGPASSWDGPYLSAEPDRVVRWGRSLAAEPGRRIGLVWQGNPLHGRDRFRSAPLAAFAPLADIPGVRLFALQVGPATSQVSEVRRQFRVERLPLEPDPAGGAFLDLAAILTHLDAVVAVDTAVAHLAGALGVRVAVGLSTVSDWRWGIDRTDTPWYPSMRLFRQRVLGDWEGVFRRVAAELFAEEIRP